MLEVHYVNQFKKDFKAFRKAPFEDLKLIFDVISKLENQTPLEKKFNDHPLIGDYVNHRECHIKPDLLLIYKIEDSKLILVRIGSHSELF